MINIDIYSTRAVIRSQEPLTVGLVGGKVKLHFSDPWKNLTRTVVFRQGDVTKDMVGVTDETRIPWEVLQLPGVPVQIGVYGSDAAGSVIIPTMWVETDPVQEGTDPSGDPSTEATLPVYQQIQGQVDKNTPFVVQITGDENTGYEADALLVEIHSARNAGRPIMAKYAQRILPLVWIDTNIAQFCSVFDRTAFMASVTNTDVKYSTRLVSDDATVDALGKTVADHTTQLNAHNGKLLEHGDWLHELDDESNDQKNAISQLQEKDRELQDQIQVVDEKGTAEAERLQNLIRDVDAQLENQETAVTALQKTATQHTIKLNAQQNAIDGHTDRLAKLEAGGVGGGGSGVHIGTEPPSDETVSLWVNPEGDAESEDAAYHDQTVTVETSRNDITLNFPCPIADFHELHIHMTGGNAVSKLYMEAGEKHTYLIDPQHGSTSGTHIHLMATHERDTMNLDVTTAAYSENAQPGVPLGTARIGNETASLRLYSKDGGKDFHSGMEIRVWGVYKAVGVSVLKVKNPETGEWESLKTLKGEKGTDGKDGEDYVLTEEDKHEIAQQAADFVDVAVPRIELTDSVATIEPNKLYVFPEMERLEIILGGTEDHTILQEYKFRFISGGNKTTLILPSYIKGITDIIHSSVYEVTILEHFATIKRWNLYSTGYLYHYGDTFEETTGGWIQSPHSALALTFGEDSMYGQGCMITANKIDLTHATALKAIVTCDTGGDHFIARLGIMSDRDKVALWDSTEPQTLLTNAAYQKTEISLDVSNITGAYYIAVSYNHHKDDVEANFYSVQLEMKNIS